MIQLSNSRRLHSGIFYWCQLNWGTKHPRKIMLRYFWQPLSPTLLLFVLLRGQSTPLNGRKGRRSEAEFSKLPSSSTQKITLFFSSSSFFLLPGERIKRSHLHYTPTWCCCVRTGAGRTFFLSVDANRPKGGKIGRGDINFSLVAVRKARFAAIKMGPGSCDWGLECTENTFLFRLQFCGRSGGINVPKKLG